MLGKKKLIIFVMAFSTIVATFSFFLWQVAKAPHVLYKSKDTYVYIKPGTTWPQLLDQLHRDSIVDYMIPFGFASKILGYQENIKPGRFLLEANSTCLNAVRKLRNAEQAPVNITFNSVRLIDELPGKICNTTIADSVEFRSLLRDTTFLNELGFDSLTVLSMFLPDTYEVYWTYDSKKILLKLKQEYNKFWTKERLQKAKDLNLTPFKVSVLASIVESETRSNEEKPVVAGLYLNRIKKGIALQSDPTLVFAAGDFTITWVLDKHKKIDSPYNTYMYAGLPPGLIRLPEKSSIDAVLNYQENTYLYMCAQPNLTGKHNFARTLTEHNKNADVYRKWNREFHKNKNK